MEIKRKMSQERYVVTNNKEDNQGLPTSSRTYSPAGHHVHLYNAHGICSKRGVYVWMRVRENFNKSWEFRWKIFAALEKERSSSNGRATIQYIHPDITLHNIMYTFIYHILHTGSVQHSQLSFKWLPIVAFYEYCEDVRASHLDEFVKGARRRTANVYLSFHRIISQ